MDFLRDGLSHYKEKRRDKRRQDSSKIQTNAAKDSSRIQMIEMAEAAKSCHGELELVDVASRQTLKKGRIRDFSAPRRRDCPSARYKIPTLEYFMDYPDEADPEAQTSYVKIAIYAERKC